MTAATVPPGPHRKKPVFLILGAISAFLILPMAVVILYYENVIITTGPSRHDVTTTAERLLRQSVPHLPGHAVLGQPKPFFDPCGHNEAAAAEATAGIEVRVSGVPAAQRAAFEKALDTQTDEHIKNLPADQGWVSDAHWPSDTSTSGTIEVGTDCIPIARWP